MPAASLCTSLVTVKSPVLSTKLIVPPLPVFSASREATSSSILLAAPMPLAARNFKAPPCKFTASAFVSVIASVAWISISPVPASTLPSAMLPIAPNLMLPLPVAALADTTVRVPPLVTAISPSVAVTALSAIASASTILMSPEVLTAVKVSIAVNNVMSALDETLRSAPEVKPSSVWLTSPLSALSTISPRALMLAALSRIAAAASIVSIEPTDVTVTEGATSPVTCTNATLPALVISCIS